MQLKTPSAPSAARAHRVRVGDVAVGQLDSGRQQLAGLRAASRTSATTSSPRSASRRATALPTLPVAPVTRNRIGPAADPISQPARWRASDEPPDPLFRRINASIGFDRRLWRAGHAGSRARTPRALHAAGVLDDDELERPGRRASTRSPPSSRRRRFEFATRDEDIHMAIERRLTEIVGPLGGKLHTGRSRNDQVATDLALYVARARASARSS